MGENPMNNEVILRNLFELCPSELLATCRLVCTTWHQLSLRSWRELTCPKLYYARDVDMFLRYWDSDFGSTPIAWEEDTDEEEEDNDDDDENSSSDDVSENKEAESIDDDQLRSDDRDADSDVVDSDHDDSSSEDKDDQLPAELGVRNSIQEFFNFVEDPLSQYATTPHRSFVLKLWNFHDQRLCRLSTLVGTQITRLCLYRCRFPGAEEFRKVVFNSCPNLEILSLYRCSFDVLDPTIRQEGTQYQEPAYGQNPHLRKLTVQAFRGESESRLPISFLELLSHFQDLSELNLYLNCEEESSNTIHKAVQAISIIRNHDQSKLPLTSFDFGGLQVSNESRELLALLGKLRIPVDSLNITLEPGMDSEVMKRALEPFMRNLTSLQIENSAGPSFPFGMVPQIWDNLQTLWLTGDTCANLEFIRFTPNLKQFFVLDHTIDILSRDAPQYRETQLVANTSQELIGDVKLLKLTSFVLDFVVSEDDLRCLTRWFPNVDYCSLVMDDGLFAILCERWQKIRFLIVYGEALTEKGITGRSRLLPGAEPALESEEDVPPNITYLQDLEVAQLHPLKLTDHSVTQGFLQLPKLEFLEFHRSSEIGEEGMNALVAKGVNIETYPRPDDDDD